MLIGAGVTAHSSVGVRDGIAAWNTFSIFNVGSALGIEHIISNLPDKHPGEYSENQSNSMTRKELAL